LGEVTGTSKVPVTFVFSSGSAALPLCASQWYCEGSAAVLRSRLRFAARRSSRRAEDP